MAFRHERAFAEHEVGLAGTVGRLKRGHTSHGEHLTAARGVLREVRAECADA